MISVTTRWLSAGLKIPIGSFSAESMNFIGLRRLLHRISHISASVFIKKGSQRLLRLSIDLFHPKIKEEEVVVDTMVQGKNITFPTDAKLAKKVIDTCRKLAIKEDISLRQIYSRTI
jgi:hypothetical protein